MSIKHSVIIVDDHQLVAQGISRFLENNPTFDVVGIYNDSREALERIKILKPEILLTDLDMPGMNGLELATEIRKAGLRTKIVLITMHLNQSVAKKVMDIKLDGYLPKNVDESEVLTCLETVLKGQNHYSSKVLEALVKGSSELEVTGLKKTQQLTERELEILTLVAEGLSTNKISEELFIAVRTVETHRKSIMEKLEVSNVAGMVRIAVQEGLLG
ncbi:MAG: response regulator transcription factor [Cyclobacteriaceae bacterium]|nr:response regulator transcription factor [Cyclobacteriaceae bacterium]